MRLAKVSPSGDVAMFTREQPVPQQFVVVKSQYTPPTTATHGWPPSFVPLTPLPPPPQIGLPACFVQLRPSSLNATPTLCRSQPPR